MDDRREMRPPIKAREQNLNGPIRPGIAEGSWLVVTDTTTSVAGWQSKHGSPETKGMTSAEKKAPHRVVTS